MPKGASRVALPHSAREDSVLGSIERTEKIPGWKEFSRVIFHSPLPLSIILLSQFPEPPQALRPSRTETAPPTVLGIEWALRTYLIIAQ